MGYAQMTSGRQSATASATARDPSICLYIGRLALQRLVDGFVRGARCSDIGCSDLLPKFVTDRCFNRRECWAAGHCRERAEQRCIRQRTSDMNECDFTRAHGTDVPFEEMLREVVQPKLFKAPRRIDEQKPEFRDAAEDVHLMQQGRVLDDHGVGFHDGLAQADFLLVDAAERGYRCAHPLGTEAW